MVRKIPFKEKFREPILSGRKVYTARHTIYGRPGEILQTPFGVSIEILGVEVRSLGWIRDNLWHREGVDSPEDFERTWREIHNGSFPQWEEVFLHHFRLHKPEVWV